MIRYNWEAIIRHTRKVKNILSFLHMSNTATKPEFSEYLLKHKYAIKIVEESKEGRYSYMKDYMAIAHNHMNATDTEMFIYMDLLSKRDYFTYLNTKRKVNYLPTWKVNDDYDINKLKTNRLLTITDGNIYFVYEEE